MLRSIIFLASIVICFSHVKRPPVHTSSSNSFVHNNMSCILCSRYPPKVWMEWRVRPMGEPAAAGFLGGYGCPSLLSECVLTSPRPTLAMSGMHVEYLAKLEHAEPNE